jgi:WD40 repeat protein
VAFSPDSQIVASGSDDKTIRLWDAKTGRKLQKLHGHSDKVYTMALSPDSQMVASGSGDETIQLWDAKTGRQYQTLQGHLDLVDTMVFSLDGQILASGSRDETIRLWDAKTGALREVLHAKTAISSIRFSTQGPYLETNNGSFRIQPFNSDHHPPISDEYSPQVSLVEDWVVLGGEKVLWLPFEYRQPSCTAIKDRTLALGYPDGRVCILQFHTVLPSLI